jgi:hypothetical protein
MIAGCIVNQSYLPDCGDMSRWYGEKGLEDVLKWTSITFHWQKRLN